MNAARGAAVTTAGQFAKIGLQFGAVVVLSRLLTPEDFGLIAMVAVFSMLGDQLRDFGITTAALQASTLSRQQQSNLFWISGGLGLVVGLALLLAAPLIGGIYDEPRLNLIVPFLAAAIVFNALGSQLQVYLARNLRFGGLMITDVGGALVGTAVAVAGAYLGLGYWALVAQLFVTPLVTLGARAITIRRLPSPPRRRSGTRAILGSGVQFGASHLLTYAASNADALVIGARYGAIDLGYYNRAFQMLTMPIAQLLGPLTNVVIPSINRALKHGQEIQRLLLRAQSVAALTLVWIYAMAASTAESLVPLVLGPQWEESVALFQLLAIGGAFQCLSHASYWGFIAHGLSRQLLLYNIMSKTLAVVLVVGASFVSVPAVAAAYSFGLALSWPLSLIWLGRSARQAPWPFLQNGLIVIAAGAVAFLTSRAMTFVLGSTMPIWQIVALTCACSVVYVGLVALAPSGRMMLRAFWHAVHQIASR